MIDSIPLALLEEVDILGRHLTPLVEGHTLTFTALGRITNRTLYFEDTVQHPAGVDGKLLVRVRVDTSSSRFRNQIRDTSSTALMRVTCVIKRAGTGRGRLELICDIVALRLDPTATTR